MRENTEQDSIIEVHSIGKGFTLGALIGVGLVYMAVLVIAGLAETRTEHAATVNALCAMGAALALGLNTLVAIHKWRSK